MSTSRSAVGADITDPAHKSDAPSLVDTRAPARHAPDLHEPAPIAVAMQDLDSHHAPLRAALAVAAVRVLESGQYILGAHAHEVRAFEEEVAAALGIACAVGVSSGSDALLAMLMAIGVKPGDEIVTTPFSFFATAGAIARLGARPVFADVAPASLTLDPMAAAQRIGPRTKAILAVHLFGRVADTQPLEGICAARGIPVLEDGAQAIGAVDRLGRRAGTMGQGAALSFFPSKNLGGFGDGGMVLTNDQAFAERVRLIRGHGAVTRFHHPVVGGNFRLDELQAALLRVKLPHLRRWTAERRRVANKYSDALSTTPLGLPPDDPGCVWNQFVVRVPSGRRNALASYLAARGIATAVYYPRPLHLQPCFLALGYRDGEFPIAEEACRDVLALPIYPELTAAKINRVVSAIVAFFQSVSAHQPARARTGVTGS